MKTNLILDGNNLLHRTFHANNRSGEPDDVVIGLCIHSALTTMNKYYNMFNPDDIIMTFDSHSWRKEYTKDLSKCVTNKKYKGTRRANQTPKEVRLFKLLDDHIDELYELLLHRTAVLTLRRNLLEGDDLMAAYVQMHRDDQNIIISGDKDMIQLLKYEGTRLINPATDEDRTLKEWDDDAGLFLFEKCVRGDSGDNVQNAYPRLRKIKLFKAYTDQYERENIMNHTFIQHEEVSKDEYAGVEYHTGALFKENIVLMDLAAQPNVIKKEMVKEVLCAKKNRAKYNHRKFLKFCQVNELPNIIERVEAFVPMLTVS